MRVADRIKNARIRLGLSRGDLARKVGVRYQSVIYWEEDVNGVADKHKRAVASVLGLTVDDLIA